MPKVGKKEFAYTDKGKKKAKAYAKETGQSVEYPTYDSGGRVKKYYMGGGIQGPSHDAGGVPIEVEGGEVVINSGMNNAAQMHEGGLLALNENPEDYEIVKRGKYKKGGKVKK